METAPTDVERAAATRDIVKDRRDEYAFHDDIVYLAETKRGLTQETNRGDQPVQGRAGVDAPIPPARVRPLHEAIAADVGWRPSKIDFANIVYYRKPSEREEKSWDDVPDQIKATFERLRIPEAERSSWQVSVRTTPRWCTTRSRKS